MGQSTKTLYQSLRVYQTVYNIQRRFLTNSGKEGLVSSQQYIFGGLKKSVRNFKKNPNASKPSENPPDTAKADSYRDKKRKRKWPRSIFPGGGTKNMSNLMATIIMHYCFIKLIKACLCGGDSKFKLPRSEMVTFYLKRRVKFARADKTVSQPLLVKIRHQYMLTFYLRSRTVDE